MRSHFGHHRRRSLRFRKRRGSIVEDCVISLDYEIYNLGDVKLQRGATLRDCKLAYKTFGTLSPRKDNVILYPTWYSGQHYDNEWLVGDGRALDPNKFFIIIPNMFGNGLSSSPSNTPSV